MIVRYNDLDLGAGVSGRLDPARIAGIVCQWPFPTRAPARVSASPMLSAPPTASSGRPDHGATAENMRVRVCDSLAAIGAGVEDDPVACLGYALGARHRECLGCHLI